MMTTAAIAVAITCDSSLLSIPVAFASYMCMQYPGVVRELALEFCRGVLWTYLVPAVHP